MGARAGSKKPTLATTLLGIVALALAWFAHSQGWLPLEEGSSTSGAAVAAPPSGGALAEAIRTRSSGVVIEDAGEVVKTLPDDDDGSRHQRFLVELPGGHTILIAHNIDLAPRAPVREGDRIEFRGQFEWNDKGGVVHWTHHDPGGRRPGGWLRHSGQTYK